MHDVALLGVHELAREAERAGRLRDAEFELEPQRFAAAVHGPGVGGHDARRAHLVACRRGVRAFSARRRAGIRRAILTRPHLAPALQRTVLRDPLGRPAIEHARSLLQQQYPLCQRRHRLHRVTHEDHRAPAARDLAHLAEALPLELGVTDSQHLVHHEDLGFQVRGDRECEPYIHPTRVALHRRIEKAFHLGEGDDLVEAGRDLTAPHAKNRAIEEDVLAPGELGVKAGAHLEQRAHASAQTHLTRGGRCDAREDLEQRALAGAVASDDTDRAPGGDRELDIAQRPEFVLGAAAERGAHQLCQPLGQRRRTRPLRDQVALAESGGLHRHGTR